MGYGVVNTGTRDQNRPSNALVPALPGVEAQRTFEVDRLYRRVAPHSAEPLPPLALVSPRRRDTL